MEQNKNLNPDHVLGKNLDYKSDPEKNYQLLGGVALLGISGLSALIASFVTSHVTKKKNQDLLRELGKEVVPVIPENPYSLALRALAWGTVWAVGGCSLIAFGIWKWYGFKNLEDLRTRLRSHIKKSPTDERTEFENVSDFLNYLNEESKKKRERGK